MEDTENIRFIVCQRIEQVENAMKSLQGLRKTLMHKAYEAKQSILNAYITQRESMQSDEMNLLIEVDKLLHSKDDVLVTQLSKLSQVLGCLRNCLQSPHPCGECLEKFDDIDMLSADEVSLEFSTANEVLKNSIGYQPQLLQMTIYPNYSASSTNEGDVMTKWLLTPSNNHSLTPATQQECIFTEWLLLDNEYSCAETGTPDIFADVKNEATDLWLNNTRSLCSRPPSTVDFRDGSISADDMERWLQKHCGSRQFSVCDDELMESDVTSSLHSSCVIISDSTSEDSSTCTRSDRTWTRDTVPANESPYKVSQWVVTCAGEGDGRMAEDGRRMSIGSMASSYVESLQATSNEWLCRMSRSDGRASDTWGHLSQDWLNDPRMDSLCDRFSSSKLDDVFAAEKSDLSREWHSRGSGSLGASWLQSSMQQTWLSGGGNKTVSIEADDWLTGEEKRDEPKMSSRSQPDRDWLLVKNEMSRIVASNDSEWVIGCHQSAVSGADNQLSTADS